MHLTRHRNAGVIIIVNVDKNVDNEAVDRNVDSKTSNTALNAVEVIIDKLMVIDTVFISINNKRKLNCLSFVLYKKLPFSC